MSDGVPPPGGEGDDGKPRPTSGAAADVDTGRWRAGQRAWLGGLQLALLLPFVRTTACDGGAVEEFRGVAYYTHPDHVVYAVVLTVVTVALLASPWSGRRDAAGVAGLGVRAWAATLAAIVATLGPVLAYLFDRPEPLAGWILHGGGWTLTALAGTAGAAALLRRVPGPARGPERLGVAALLVAPAVGAALQLVLPGSPRSDEAVGLAVGGWIVAAPLAVAGVALARAGTVGAWRRAGWWLAAVATVGAVGLAGSGV